MIIKDFADNDLYKFTTMFAIQKLYPKAMVKYKFINRGKTVFPEGFAEEFRKEIDAMKDLQLSDEMETYIRKQCYFFDPVFVDFLKGYRFNPNEVCVKQAGGKLDVTIEGYWYRTVLWEVPLMAIICELYYKMIGAKPINVKEIAIKKAGEFKKIGAEYSEFGTRRRFSFSVQEEVIQMLKEYSGSFFKGTSNLYFAYKHNLIPVGTHPHEWFMYHGAIYGYRVANEMGLEAWVDVYQGSLGTALADTYTSDVFFRSFSLKHAKLFDGIRTDSGDPIEFTNKALDFYRAHKIDPRTKTIVYSDALNLNMVRKIRKYVNGQIHDVYGIGTFLTNDVGVKPLNIVIKISHAKEHPYKEYLPTIKLTDAKLKNTGNDQEIELCKRVLNLK